MFSGHKAISRYSEKNVNSEKFKHEGKKVMKNVNFQFQKKNWGGGMISKTISDFRGKKVIERILFEGQLKCLPS